MNGVAETIARLKEENLDVAIISGSFDVVAEKVKNKLGIEKFILIVSQLKMEN